MGFYRQWGAAGMLGKIPIASTTFALGNEHIMLNPSEVNGLRVSYNYFQEIETPVNQAFVEKWHARFGADYPYISELAMSTYQGIMLWAEAVRQAGTTDRMALIETLETGIGIDAPSGRVTIHPQTHHVLVDVHIAEVQDHAMRVVETFAQQQPTDTAAVCDLIQNPDRQSAIRTQGLETGRASTRNTNPGLTTGDRGGRTVPAPSQRLRETPRRKRPCPKALDCRPSPRL